MAITIYSRNDCDILFARQTAWGTALADNVAMSIFDGEASVIDPDYNIRKPNRSNSGSRITQDFNIQEDTLGTAPKITLTGDMKVGDAAHFFYAAIQGLTSEGASTPFRKIFTHSATQPDFTAISGLTSPGYVATIIEKQPVSGASVKIRDAICTNLTLTCAPDAGNGRLQLKAEMVGRGPANMASVPAGAYTRTGQTFFNFHDINAFTGDSLPLFPLGFELTISQPGTKGVSTDLAGQSKTFAVPSYEVTAKVKVIDDSNARTLRASWGTIHSKAWVFSWTTLLFNMQATITSAPKILEDVNAVEFTLQGVKATSVAALTVTLDDDVDRGWT
jgi:hypothetical protein